MCEKQVVGDMSDWSGMLQDMFRQVSDGSLTKPQFQAFLEHRDPFAITDIRAEWTEFYRKYFRLTVDFSDVAIPDNPGGFDRVVFIPKGLTHAQVVKALRKQFKVYLYNEDLDGNVPTNDRTAEHNYAVRFRNRVEADEELASTSANQLKEQGMNCITLLERLVLELKYWAETGGEHLDIKNWTLCAGSRSSGGDVPRVGWDGDRLGVDWYGPSDADGGLRGRQAVS